jgi:threonine/homoserine/homoserine lactone efflux protein
MSFSILLAFVVTCVLLALTPGPNMSLIIANTLSGGMRAGYTTLMGAATGLSILALTAALGMSSIMVFMAEWFDVVRWVGAVYLVFLGARQIWSWRKRRLDATFTPPPVSARNAYVQGLLVALSNPKVLLFLGAFLPQFVNPDAAALPQLLVLAGLFVATLLVVDSGYTYVVGRARQALDAKTLLTLDGIAGGLLVVGGIVLAAARRPA